MPNENKLKGMPSILDEVGRPFSAPKSPTGVSDDFTPAFQQWQTARTPENNTKLLSTVQPVIETALSSYGGASNVSPNLRSRAKLMALRAMETYDPAKGNVRTHLLSQLQSLRRASAKEQNIISIPEQVGLDYQRLVESENELRDQLGREPLDSELADHTALSTRRIRKIRSFNQPLAEGSTVEESSDDSGGDPVASAIPGSTRAADAWLDFVYEDLGPTDKLIMDMTLGRNGRRRASTQEIAQKLKITPGAVSQRAAKIQTMLDKRYTYGGF
jgi:DNA-directed RNA polymerase specialized sigma subunit